MAIPLDVSVVAPVHNEEKNLEILSQKLFNVLSNTQKRFEIVFVDDGSTDGSLEIMMQLRKKYNRFLKIIKLKKSYGQTAALAAGIDYAQGEVIILMDADLQHDPDDIPKFLEKIDQGYDIVSGWRKERVDPLRRKLPSLIANWLMAKISGIKIHDFGTTFKAYKKGIIKNVKLYGQFHRFIPVLAKGKYASIVEVPITSGIRGGGKSSYGLWGRTITVLFDLIRLNFLSRYLSRPLQFFGSLGLLIGASGFGIAVFLVYLKYVYSLPLLTYRAPLFLLSVLLMGIGMQFLTLGLLGEIIVKAYYDNPNTKIYAVEEVLE